MQLRAAGKLSDRLFAETRLRRGVYGQRYDNGKRHDGVATRDLLYPSAALTKGPNTLWDAPGMQRLRIPAGRLNAEQMDVVAQLAEEYADGVLHVTTRQDIQFHFVHIEDTPSLMRRLGAVGITTREACGNVVRNVTACPYAGVCNDESFDVGPHANALAGYLLGHEDALGFGRKFKISFSGCQEHACALAHIHDLGCVAVTRRAGDAVERGFDVYVGGGLGAVPHKAQQLDSFVPEHELLPLAQSVCRVFARLGEKKNRTRARLKFVVARLGMDEFRREVALERERVPPDERWTAHLGRTPEPETPLKPGSPLSRGPTSERFAAWSQTSARPQAQPGYVTVTVRCPLGDVSSAQMRALADVVREHTGTSIRLTVDQNILLRWVPQGDLPAVHEALDAIGLGEPGAGTITDITACPGTDTCKLGIASSRGLASALQADLAARSVDLKLDAGVDQLRIKASGCFNSCGQHHVADIGFLGVSRNVGGPPSAALPAGRGRPVER